jgi:YVTN family beta-propeller protein
MGKLILILSLSVNILLWSCNKNDPGPVIEKNGPFPDGNGVFILNEGNFSAGNGSLSFYSYDSSKIYNNIFFSVNSRPLGDVPNSMIISGDKAYIVVNNSGTIEVIEKKTASSLKTIGGFVSPRNMLLISSSKAYVSSMYSDKVAILNMQTNSISGYIAIRRTSEAMLLKGEKAYISCWVSGKDIMIIDTKTDKVIDSVEVGHEPESMVLDKANRLWVLCSGGYSGQYNAELIAINTTTDEIEKRLVFPSTISYPSSLQINKTADTIYYIDGAIWRMDIASSSLPVQPFLPSSGRLYYKMGIDPVKGEIFVTNAIDYVQRGYLLRLKANGSLIDSTKADIIPGSLCFKLN